VKYSHIYVKLIVFFPLGPSFIEVRTGQSGARQNFTILAPELAPYEFQKPYSWPGYYSL